MKIAKVFMGNPTNQKGRFNNCHERTIRLAEKENVDAYMIRSYDSFIVKLLKGKLNCDKRDEFVKVDSVTYKNIWVKFNIIEYIFSIKINLKANIYLNELKKNVDKFKKYDLLSTHSFEGAYLGYLVKQKYQIPYSTSWHGSDINIFPFKNKKYAQLLQKIQSEALMNFFVSQKLLDTSKKFYSGSNTQVLYTGIASRFKKMSPEEVQAHKRRYNISTKLVVGFVGNLVHIKNVLILPDIFKSISSKISEITFVIIGWGELEKQLKRKFESYNMDNVIFLGNREPEEMPKIMNCIDLLVLPSINEGLPRVTLEAIHCGVQVVGSDRGGIPESIGEENTFSLDKDFTKNISEKAVQILNKLPQKTDVDMNKFSWNNAINRELEIYKDFIKNNTLV